LRLRVCRDNRVCAASTPSAMTHRDRSVPKTMINADEKIRWVVRDDVPDMLAVDLPAIHRQHEIITVRNRTLSPLAKCFYRMHPRDREAIGARKVISTMTAFGAKLPVHNVCSMCAP